MKASNVYVDGFNLYYGALKGTKHKWLDLQKLFTMLRPDDDVQTIHYFTAPVIGRNQPDQQRYLDALATCAKVRITLGRYAFREMTCRVLGCHHPGSKQFKRPEEKQTDVNIALQMLDDAYQRAAERFVLVTGDSDLVPAINVVRARAPSIEVIVYVPSNHMNRGAAVELRGAAHKHRTLPAVLLPRAQFPPTVTGYGGAVMTKPTDW